MTIQDYAKPIRCEGVVSASRGFVYSKHQDNSKPIRCPCCGREPVVMLDDKMRYGEWVLSYRVKCPLCGLQTEAADNRKEVVSVWNRRDGMVAK